MVLGSCYTCQGVPPICPECINELSERWNSSARAFGWRWGARLRITMDVRGEASRSWPAWESEPATDLRRICRKIVEPLASAVPERRDPRLVEIFARVCASAAREAYLGLTLEEAREVVADWDRRFPTWQRDLIQRLRG
ncbi:MAG: hypothetical protein HS111_09890 [Kofleriaceae bacterium]|nr:hypothetical protein [Kofleriaceae bacterium]